MCKLLGRGLGVFGLPGLGSMHLLKGCLFSLHVLSKFFSLVMNLLFDNNNLLMRFFVMLLSDMLRFLHNCLFGLLDFLVLMRLLQECV